MSIRVKSLDLGARHWQGQALKHHKPVMDEPLEFTPTEQSVRITIAKMAVSLQSSKGVKNDFQKHVRKNLRLFDFFISGDVQVEVIWRMSHRKRYETADRPDVDNILKPILDSISGPEGILFDDCQVMSVFSAWHSWQHDDHEELLVRLDYLDGDTVSKHGLVFVEIEQMLCFPLDLTLPEPIQAAFLWQCEKFFEMRKSFDQLNIANVSQYCSPAQRLYHKSRVQQFKLSTLEVEKKRLRESWPELPNPI